MTFANKIMEVQGYKTTIIIEKSWMETWESINREIELNAAIFGDQ